MIPRKTNEIRPLAITRALYSVFHQVFLGGGVAERDAAYQEVEEEYRAVYERKNSRSAAELELIRSMVESIDDDTKFWIKALFRTAYWIAKIVSL